MAAPSAPVIGGVVLCQNSSRTLRDCLLSMAFVNRLVVVDSGSTDRSPEIAKEVGAEVLHHAWEGYAAQRNWAADAVGTDWVMFLDSDEVLSDGGGDEVRALASGDVQGISFPFITYIRGERLLRGRFGEERHLRAFRRGLRFAGDVHELLVVSPAQEARATHPIHHFTYRSLEHAVSKANAYSTLLARAGVRRGYARSMSGFLMNYVIKGGWMDGRAGLDAHLIDLLADVLTTRKVDESRWGPNDTTSATVASPTRSGNHDRSS